MKYSVYDVMTLNPVTINKEDSVQAAAKLMAEKRVASLVVKEGEVFLGLITEKDIARKLAADNMVAADTKVDDIMSKDVKTTSPTADIVRALQAMSDLGQRQFPVLENNKLVGLLTQKDVLRVQPQLFGLVYENISLREEDRKPLYKSETTEGACDSCGNYSIELEDSDSQMICSECKLI